MSFRTHIGRTHRVNQDAGGAWTWVRTGGYPISLLLVADGVSSGRHSEEASRIAVQLIQEAMLPLCENPAVGMDDLLAGLVEATREANHTVARRPHQSITSADATTLVGAVCLGREVRGIWCGDSRAYLFHGFEPVRLTQDHAWAESMISSGVLTPEAAARDSRARMITRWLGPPDEADPGIDRFQLNLTDEDVLVCCSDGLSVYFSPPVGLEAEMVEVATRRGPDLEAASDALLQEALGRGGHDDITLALLAVRSATD